MVQRMKKIPIKPYKAHKHLGRGVGSSEEFIQYSYKGRALNRVEQLLVRKLNKLIEERNDEKVRV